jgi:hypothetical protein
MEKFSPVRVVLDTDLRLPPGGALANSARETRYYGGVSWEATAATTGTLKFGRVKRDFTSSLTPDETDTSWEGMINWAPRTYSQVQFLTSRQTNEASGEGSFILTEAYQVSWNHNWSSYLTTGVTARWQRDEYQNFDRTDDTRSLGLRVGYRFRPWLTLGASTATIAIPTSTTTTTRTSIC